LSDVHSDVIHIVAAVIADADGRVLLVRKHGSAIFIQPGGKREAGEASLETLRRELAEELGVEAKLTTALHLGEFEEAAVHETGRRVRAEVFMVDVEGVPSAGAEIEELRWFTLTGSSPDLVAPLTFHHIFPAVAGHRSARAP
jgi:8-oxo-dGTP pyrophosphatase MutT (NUDIX family)